MCIELPVEPLDLFLLTFPQCCNAPNPKICLSTRKLCARTVSKYVVIYL